MFSTREIVNQLAEANPGVPVTEEHVRRALRTGKVEAPSTIGGRYVWLETDLPRLADALELNAPSGVEVKP